MNMAPVIERGKAAGLPRLQGASGLALLKDKPPQHLPATYAYALKDKARAPRDITGVHDQIVDCDFRIVAFCNAAGPNPAAADAEVDALRAKIEDLYAGWVHPDAEGIATAYVGHELLSLAGSVIAFEVNFRTVRRVRKAVEL